MEGIIPRCWMSFYELGNHCHLFGGGGSGNEKTLNDYQTFPKLRFGLNPLTPTKKTSEEEVAI